MRQVRPWLYVGKVRETRDTRLLAARGIGVMLQLAEPVQQPGIVSRYLAIEDGEPIPFALLREGVEFVLAEGANSHGRAVLVACGAGISRSTSFAIAALKEAEDLTLLDALRAVAERHPEGEPHPVLWASLCAYYQEQVPFLTVMQVLAAARPESWFAWEPDEQRPGE